MKVGHLAAGVVAGFLVLAVIDWRFDGRIDRLEEAMGFTQEDELHSDHSSGHRDHREREHSSQGNYFVYPRRLFIENGYRVDCAPNPVFQMEYYVSPMNDGCECNRW